MGWDRVDFYLMWGEIGSLPNWVRVWVVGEKPKTLPVVISLGSYYYKVIKYLY
jgi:hypothetical protein